MNKKIKCYELDFGDTNFISKDVKDLLEWMKSSIGDMADDEQLFYTITVKYMTRKEYNNLPEWA